MLGSPPNNLPVDLTAILEQNRRLLLLLEGQARNAPVGPFAQAAPVFQDNSNNDGVVIMTADVKKTFVETTLGLKNAHMYGLQEEGIEQPSNFSKFTSEEVLVVFKNLTKHSPAFLIPAFLSKRIMITCDFMCYLVVCGQDVRPTMLDWYINLYFA